MSATERDFSTFHLGDNVYELAEGIIPDLAEELGVPIADEPTTADLQQIMNQVGTKKELRTNPELELDRDVKVDYVQRSGIQKMLRRSLWTPEVTISKDNVDAIVALGGVANWQDRTADIIDELPLRVPTYLLMGNRTMSQPTEQANPSVDNLYQNFKRYPTEAEYAASVIVPRLVRGRPVLMTPFETDDGDTILKQFFERGINLTASRLAMARVANAGVVMAVQMRDAARRVSPEFDTDPANPQVFIATDSFPIAETAEQEKDAVHYQKSDTAIRQLVLTAKKLHEAGSEQ